MGELSTISMGGVVYYIDDGRVVYYIDDGRVVYYIDGRVVYYIDDGRVVYYIDGGVVYCTFCTVSDVVATRLLCFFGADWRGRLRPRLQSHS